MRSNLMFSIDDDSPEMNQYPILQVDLLFVENMVEHSLCEGAQRQRMRRNLLAVKIVERWLSWFDIEVDWLQSYSANPYLHRGEDIADLYLPNIGRLECRVVVPGDVAVEIPLESHENRLGYMVVELSKDLEKATLRGFLPETTATMVPLEQLEPVDAIFTAIAICEEKNSVWQKLKDWAQNALTHGWQNKQPELSTLQPSLAPMELGELYEIIRNSPSIEARRNAIKVLPMLAKKRPEAIELLAQVVQKTEDPQIRWDAAMTLKELDPNHPNSAVYQNKLFNFGVDFSQAEVELIVALLAIPDQKIKALIKIKPVRPQAHLPSGLNFRILDEQGQMLRETNSREQDSHLKMSFTFEPGDYFRINLSLGDCHFTEDIEI